MEFAYYLVKNQEIIKRFLDSDKGAIEQFFIKLFNESGDFDEVQVYMIPVDFFVFEYCQVVRYGTNVTRDYLDDDGSIIM